MKVYNLKMANNDGYKRDLYVAARDVESAIRLARDACSCDNEYGMEPTSIFELMPLAAIEGIA